MSETGPVFDDLFRRIPALLPESERAEALQLTQSVLALQGFVHAFESALQLFEFCAAELKPIEQLAVKALREGVPIIFGGAHPEVFGWTRIACRDGALQLFHFATAMQAMKGSLYLAPALRSQTDCQKLKLATKLMDSLFPHWEFVRHAVAHSPQESMPSVASRIAGRLGPYSVGEVIDGPRYVIIKDRVVGDYVLDRNSLERMERIRITFMAGFAALVARVRNENPKPWP